MREIKHGVKSKNYQISISESREPGDGRDTARTGPKQASNGDAGDGMDRPSTHLQRCFGLRRRGPRGRAPPGKRRAITSPPARGE